MNGTKLSRREFSGAVIVGVTQSLLSEGGNQDIGADIWPTVQGDAARTGNCVTSDGRSIHGGTYWEVNVGGEMTASPVVTDGIVLVGTRDGELFAYELADGTRRWKREGTASIQRTLAVDPRNVYVNLDEGTLSALDVRTGETHWQTTLEAKLSKNSGPVIVDGTLYACDETGYVYAIDAASGEIRWKVDPELAASAATMAVSDGRVFVVSDLFMGALDTEDGHRIWRTEIGRAIWGPPTVAGDVYVPLGPDSKIAAFSAETGDLKWAFTTFDETATSEDYPISPRSPIVSGESIIVADTGGNVLAAARADGNVQWRHSITNSLVHHPVACGDTVYLPTDEHLVAFSTSSGEVQWRTRVGGTPTSPAIAGDRLLVSTTNGRLLAFGRERSFLDRWGLQLGVGLGAGLTGLGGYAAYRKLRGRED